MTLLSAHNSLWPENAPAGVASRFTDGAGETVSERIGRYKLLQKIGEGGCGVVYLAEQERPVRRRVALKLIKIGMDTKAVIARFEAERQALAMMDHPNIARVLDAGASETGRPFFIMELVRGVRITEYCDQHRLSTAQRLALFSQVCHAIEHAHQKGIIHRDIKPSNILVALHQDAPVPKVIDFGIAKATQGRLTEQTLFTAFEQFIGTPAYVSPEQADMSGLDLDARSDIYSLGVLLYELLAGRKPFETTDLAQTGIDEFRRRLREEEPQRPSVRLRSLSATERVVVAKARNTEGAALAAQLDGDLDWIVLRCLEKDRARRYETAASLALDIERHLRHEPVVARPPSAAYLLQKFIRRHRLRVLSVAAIVASLVTGLTLSTMPFHTGAFVVASLLAGLTASTVLYLQERHAEREKQAAVKRALIEKAGAEEARAEEARLRLQAENNEERAQREAARSAQVAQFLKDMFKDADALVALGHDTKLLRGIIDLTAERLDTDLRGQPDVEADLREIAGSVYLNLDLFDRAAAMFTQALAVRRSLRGAEHPEVACTLNYLGVVLHRQGKLAEAEEMIRLATSMQEKLLGRESAAVAESLGNLGLVLAQQDKPGEAEGVIREALQIQEKLHGREHVDVARSLKKMGAILQQQGRPTEVENCLREALAINQKLLGNQHPEVASSFHLLGVALVTQGFNIEAEACYREALAIRQHMPAAAARSSASLISALEQQGTLSELDGMLARTVALARARYGPESWEAAFAIAPRIYVYLLERKYVEAEAQARECLAIRERERPDDWSTYFTRSMLGGALAGQKKYEEAEPYLLAGYHGLVKHTATLTADNVIRPREAAGRLVQLYNDWAKPDTAASWQQKVQEHETALKQPAVGTP